jgi:hypothetical protein
MEDLETRNKHTIQKLYDNVLPELAKCIHQKINPILPLFENFVLERLLDTWTKEPGADGADKISIENGNIHQLGLKLRLEGFNKPGAESFDLIKDLIFKLEYNMYTVGPGKNQVWVEKQYMQPWNASDYEEIAEKWSEELIDTMMQKLAM